MDEEKLVPGTGEIICAKAEPPGVLVGAGVKVAVAVGVFDGVSDGPTVGDGVGVRVAVGLMAGVVVAAPGPYV